MTLRTMINRYATAKTIPLVVLAVFLLAQIVWVSLSPTSVQAAPTISAATTGTMTTSSKTFSYNAGSTDNRILVVAVASDDRTNRISGITYDGDSLTQAYSTGQLAPSSATARIQMFYLLNPSEGTNNLTINATASDNYAYVVAYVSGADIDSVGTVNNNSGTGSSLSVSNSPEESDSLIVTAFGSDSTTAFSPSGGSTEVGETSASGIRAGLYTKPSPTGASVTTNANGGNLGWGAIALEIKVPVVLPQVNISVEDGEATEPGQVTQGDSATFEFYREGDSENDLDIQIYIDGDSTADFDDYEFDLESSTCDNISSSEITIPSGRAFCTLVIDPQYDEEYTEDTETIQIFIDDSSAYEIGEGIRGTVYIYNTENEEGGGGGGIDCEEQPELCDALDYNIHSPGFASMYIYDDDTVPAGQVNTFTATPARVQSGGVATLSWNISGMSSCSIDNGVGAVDATDGLHTATTPAITTRITYTLSCNDGVATVISRVSVGIVPTFIEQ